MEKPILNFKLRKNEVALCFGPNPEDTVRVLLTESVLKKAREEANNVTKPVIVVGVGEDVPNEDLNINVGDFVYLKNFSIDVGTKIVNDPKRNWKNFVIIPVDAVLCKVIYTEPYEVALDELIAKAEEVILYRESQENKK